MPFRYFLVLSFSLISCYTAAQSERGIRKSINEIDSLIIYNQFEKAENKADSMYAVVKMSKQHDLRLKVLLQKGISLYWESEYNIKG